MSALREAVLLQMRLRGFAQNTVDTYLHAMEQLWEFYKRVLEGLSCAEVQRFLDEIITVRKRAWATVNVYFSAYPKPTPGDPSQALNYVARYTHKVAISDSRIKELRNGQVTYSWRDRSDDNTEKTETIPVELFTRRFLAHILPVRFHKIRYFGWLAAGNRKAILAAIRAMLHVEALVPAAKESLTDRIRRETGVDLTLCPQCGKGHFRKTDRRIQPRGQSP